MTKPTILVFFLSVMLFFPLFSQWRSSLYPVNWTPPDTTVHFYFDAFLQDFSYAGYHRGTLPVPHITQNIIDVTKAPFNADTTGEIDATTSIQEAINQVQEDGGGVVFLPAGTYKIAAGNKSECLRISAGNTVLRGAGIDKTFLFNNDIEMNGKTILRISPSEGTNWDRLPSTFAKITKDLPGPTQLIPVDQPELFEIGDEVIVRNRITAAWANEHQEPEWADAGTANTLDGILHFREVTAVDLVAKTITIDAPIRYALLTRDNPTVNISTSNMLSEIGLEDFSIGNREVISNENDWLEVDGSGNPRAGLLDDGAHTDSQRGAFNCSKSSAIHISRVRNSWLKHVHTYQPTGNIYGTHILSNGTVLDQCSGITLDDVYMGYSQYGGGSGNAYGFRIESNDCLFINCAAEVTRHGFSFVRMYAHGNVLHQSRCIESGRCTGNSLGGLKTGSSGSDFHQWFSLSNLIDQMRVDKSYWSALHRKGVGSDHNAVTAHSVFWNFTANDAPNGYGIRSTQTRYGYVVGTQGNSPAVNYQISDLRNLLNPSVTGISFAFRYDTDGSRTNPEDLVEGEGMAASLEPQSLYLDQLQKRLGLVNNTSKAQQPPDFILFPNPSKNGVFYLSKTKGWAVFSISGKQLLSGHSQLVDLQSFPRGIYLLKVANMPPQKIIF
ncbi:MAG: glycosyl hydrolase family 28-related protein [Bacteroidota bacterium]